MDLNYSVRLMDDLSNQCMRLPNVLGESDTGARDGLLVVVGLLVGVQERGEHVVGHVVGVIVGPLLGVSVFGPYRKRKIKPYLDLSIHSVCILESHTRVLHER